MKLRLLLFLFYCWRKLEYQWKNQGVEAKPVCQQARVRYNLDRSLVTETNNQTPTILSSANLITQNLIIILHQSYNPF